MSCRLSVLLSLVAIGVLAASAMCFGAIDGTSGVVFSRESSIWHLPDGVKKARKLTQGQYPAISPDGKRVAFCRSVGGKNDTTDIFIQDIGSGKSSRIIRCSGTVSELTWSPKEGVLAFACWNGGKDQLRVVKTDGSGARTLISGGQGGSRGIFAPEWSTDGKSLLFHDIFTLFRADLSGSVVSKTPLSQITGRKSSVTSTDRFVPCSADGNLLAFTQSVPGSKLADEVFGEPNTALFTYNTSTKVRKRLTPVDLLATDPSWARDGKRIYFCGYRDRSYNEEYPFRIYRISRDGSALTELIKGESPTR